MDFLTKNLHEQGAQSAFLWRLFQFIREDGQVARQVLISSEAPARCLDGLVADILHHKRRGDYSWRVISNSWKRVNIDIFFVARNLSER